MSASWVAWARTLRGMTPSELLVISELASLVDTRGVAMVTSDHLCQVTARSPSSIKRALKGLSEKGVLRRERLRVDGHYGVPRIQLIRRQEPGPKEKTFVPIRSGIDHLGDDVGVEEPINGEQLRHLIQETKNEGWNGKAAEKILRVLLAEGTRRFGRIIRQRRLFGDERDEWDTLSLAWETVQTSRKWIIEARDPWAVWVTSVGKAAVRADSNRAEAKDMGIASFEPEVLAQIDCNPIEGEGENKEVLGIDDFGEHLHQLVSELIAAGMPETLAWAGTARVVELIAVGESRRHWLAGRDARLQALGINDQAARAWMSAVAGTRRSKTRIFEMTSEEAKTSAQAVVEAWALFVATA